MKAKKNILIALISVVISFILYRFLLLKIIDQLPFYAGEYQFLYFVIILLMLSAFVFIILRGMINNKLDNLSKKLLWFQYFFVLCFLLFGRNVGFRAMELNLVNSIKSWVSDSFSIVVNIGNLLMFMPTAFFFKEKSFKFSICVMTCIFVMCELLQYTFALGAFDVGDLLLYILGFTISFFFAKKCKM